MGIEIERKYTVNPVQAPVSNQFIHIKQGYLNSDPNRCVRIRITGEQAYLTIKGASEGPTRAEFEYSIPKKDAEELMRLCETEPISKTRYFIEHGNHLWELDIFEGPNKGLAVAEIELNSENETFELPDWVEKEVTEDYRYANAWLSQHPYQEWTKS